MRPIRAGASAVLLAIVLLSTSFCVFADDSDALEVHDGSYGQTVEVDSAQIEAGIVAATGKTFQQWVSELSDSMTHYDINTLSPAFMFEMSMRRDVNVDDDYYTYYDHYAGYFDILLDSDISGYFPAPGTYYRNEGELTPVFLYRLFSQGGDVNVRDTNIHLDLKIYFDISAESKVDVRTNQLVSSVISLRLSIHEAEHNNISLHITQDDDGELESLTIGYEDNQVNNMLYLNFEVELSISDMHLRMAETEWYLEPLAVAHVNRCIVSSDLADGVWGLALESMGDDAGSVELPSLLLKILGSGSRMLDLFDTIESLTSAEMPDIGLTGDYKAWDYNDGEYDYCRIQTITSEPAIFDFGWNGYNIDTCQLIMNIPDSILPGTDAQKAAGKAVAVAIVTQMGYAYIDVHDLSSDPATASKCARIESHVNAMIDKDEVTSYHIPDLYIWLAGGGLALTAAVVLVLWRLRP